MMASEMWEGSPQPLGFSVKSLCVCVCIAHSAPLCPPFWRVSNPCLWKCYSVLKLMYGNSWELSTELKLFSRLISSVMQKCCTEEVEDTRTLGNPSLDK